MFEDIPLIVVSLKFTSGLYFIFQFLQTLSKQQSRWIGGHFVFWFSYCSGENAL